MSIISFNILHDFFLVPKFVFKRITKKIATKFSSVIEFIEVEYKIHKLVLIRGRITGGEDEKKTKQSQSL